MQDDRVKSPSSQTKRVRAEGRKRHRNMLVVVGAHRQERVSAGRSIMSNNHFPPPDPSHQANKIFDLRSFDAGEAEGVEHRGNPSAEAKRKSTPRQAMHRHRKSRSHHRVPGVVVGGGRGDAQFGGDGAHGTRERRGFLDIEALRNKSRA